MTKETTRRWIGIERFSSVGSPAISRDGEWIAFDAYPEGSALPHCVIARRDGSEVRKLTAGATPRWSPDGSQLVFMRERRYYKPEEAGVFVIQRDGGGERRLGEGRWPDWSPDGRRIAFCKGDREDKNGVVQGGKVFVAAADGSDAQYVADGDCAAWSPDGKKIACHVLSAAGELLIRVVTIETKEAVVVGNGWFRAEWLPDGKSLVCHGYLDEARTKTGMVRLSAEAGHKSEPLFPEFPGAHSPCPSIDGKSIVFFVAPTNLRATVK